MMSPSSFNERQQGLFAQAKELAKKELTAKRLSGEYKYEQNLRMAQILIDNNVDAPAIIAALLYGIEKRRLPSDIQERFGKEIADLVFGQVQLESIKEKNKDSQAEVLRQVLVVALHDVRILFVKLANKLDNLNTIDVLPAVEQRRIAKEVLDIYSPLANRLGLEKLRLALDERAFMILHPKEYRRIKDFLQASEEQREAIVQRAVDTVKRLCDGLVHIERIKGRHKHIYSIYKKTKNSPLEEINDLHAIRIIVNTVAECYTVLGILHKHLTPKKGTFKDYVAHPKPNNYRSIHTALIFPSSESEKEGDLVEVQIRTVEMDAFAEEGGAAHWAYKQLKSDAGFEKRTAWLRDILEVQKNEEFLEQAKINLFADTMYCFTPKGKAVQLPSSASVLDFAYHIHQEIGDTCVGGRVNGIFAPMRKKLKNGDVVEVLTHKQQRPRRDWMKYVISQRAQSKIRSAIKRNEGLPAPTAYLIRKEQTQQSQPLAVAIDFPHYETQLAKCCHPVFHDSIIGILKGKSTVSVHTIDCERAQVHKTKQVEVQWQDQYAKPLIFEVQAVDRSGILADILHTMTRLQCSVLEAKAKLIHEGMATCVFKIAPQKLEQLQLLSAQIVKVAGVQKIKID